MTSRPALARRTLLLSGSALAALALAACGGGSGSGASDAGGAEQEIVIGTTNEPTSMQRNVGGSSGISETTSRNVYEGLTAVDETGAVIDVLAKTVEVSEDGLTVTITLQDGVLFHDGSPLTSTAAAWSIGQAIAPESKSARASDLRVITGIDTPDEATLVLTLAHRSASLRFFLASVTIVRDGDTENTSENGTGPYRLEEWVQGDHLTLTRNEDYWGERAKNPGVTFRFFADETAMNNALRTGELDLVLQQQSPDQLSQFEDPGQYTITEGSSIQKWVWTFNNEVAPFDDVRVRQALYTAIDRPAILSAVWGDKGVVIGSMPPVSEPWYDASFAEIHAYDPAAATALLAEAGQTSLSVPLTYVAGSTEEIIVQQIASDLEAIGVSVQLDAIDDSTWYERVYTNKDYSTTLMSHNNPRDVLWYANPDFYWQYDNAEVQQLAVAAEEAGTEDEQVQDIHALSRIIAEEAPSAWLFMAPQIRIAAAGVTGFSPDKNAEPFVVANIVREGA
ncbi:ABC transporter substrate-binding protein [Brachybacterium hainanense]|uniref:ABC transporter substrate-binding protein n=1 Tax=Brachybacterium hainanense TaxID=1541174 RepID=A0ABV6RD62_9MICO